MRRTHLMAVALFSAANFFGPFSASASAGLGLFCAKKDCSQRDCCQADGCSCKEKCCKPKRHCCLFPSDAPDAEIGFALPGVVRPGQAARVTESALNQALQTAVRSSKTAESATSDKALEDRVNDLEQKMQKIDGQLDRLSRAVESLAEKR